MAEPVTDPLAGFGRRLATNMSWLSLSQVIALAISVVTVSVLGRALTEEEWAALGYGIAIMGVGLSLADPGLSTTLVRDLSHSPERTEELVGHTLGLRLVLASIAMVLIGGYALLALEGPFRLAAIVVSIALFTQAMAAPNAILQARVMVKAGTAIEVANRVSGFAVMMIAVAAGLGLGGALTGILAGEVAGLIVLGVVVSRLVTVRPQASWPVWRSRLRLSVTVAGAAILSVVVMRLGFFMLEKMSTVAETANLSSAYRLTMLVERVPQLALATLFPVMSSLSSNDVKALSRLYHWALVRAVGLAVVIVAVGWPLAPTIVSVLLGEAHLTSVPALRWLLAYTALLCVAAVAGNMLIVLHQTRVSLGIWVAATPISVLLNWWWIPAWGAAGAALATCVTMGLVLLAAVVAAQWELSRR